MAAPVRTLSTRQAFAHWLDREMSFDDAFVDRIDPLPSPGPLPHEVRLVFRVQVAGSLRAGESRHMRELVLLATGVSRFELPVDGFVAGSCCHGVDMGDDSSSPISLLIDVPMELRLDCAQLDVAEREWEEAVPPWFSDREFFAVVRDAALPSPEQWTKVLADVGLHAVWRCYGGPAEDLASVPREYEGWFLQQADRVESTVDGVLFFAAKRGEGGFRVALQRWTEKADPLWSACARFLGTFPDVVISCGNASLSGPAWLAHLAGG